MLTLEPAETRCLSCRRRLRSARSVARGRGPRCWAKVLASAAAELAGEYSGDQLGKARELLELGAVIPTRRRHVFRVVSSSGTHPYVTAIQACTCPAGLHGRRCYHRAAVTILLTADARRGEPVALAA